MGRYLLRRIGHSLLVLVAISIATFLLVRVAPGNPALIALGPHATKEAIAQLDHQYGLDQPLPEQYVNWVSGLAHGNFGDSIRDQVSVSSLVGPRMGPSALLIAYSLLMSTIVGVPLGVYAARRKNRAGDHIVRVTTTAALAMPAFWVGLLLSLIFSIKLGLFPVAGYGAGFVGHLESLTLPAIAVAFLITPLVVRTVRAGVLETVSADFVEAVEARGLTPPRILFKHVLRNGIIPTVTLLGVAIGVLLGGTVVVENVFAIPGLGTLLVSSVQARDFPVIEVLAVLFGCVVVVVNLMTDVAYVAIDPRVRL